MTKAKIGDTGTLDQLGVQAGDVVEFIAARGCFKDYTSKYAGTQSTVNHSGGTDPHENGSQGWNPNCPHVFRLISRAKPQPTIFDEMTDAEQGALLLAKHRGEVIQMLTADYDWKDCMCSHFIGALAYRIKPKPVVEEREQILALDVTIKFTHKLTYNRVDGEIDCASAVMVKL